MQLANADFMQEFNTLGYDIPEEDVAERLNGDGPGYEHLDDDQIVEYVQQCVQNEDQSDADDDEDDDDDTIVACPIRNTEAMHMFGKCLIGLRHQEETSTYNTSILLSLKNLAAKKRQSTLTQTNITSYFK